MLVNQTDKKGAGRINIKIRSHGKKRLNPERSTTSTPRLYGQVSSWTGRCPPANPAGHLSGR